MAESGCLKDSVCQNLQVDGKMSITGPSIESGLNYRKVIDQRLLNTGGAVTTTLTREQSGTMFLMDGTGNLVVNLPALSTSNVGIEYEFLVTTAVGSGKTVTFVLPGGGVSNFFGNITLSGAAGVCAVTHDVAGDTLSLVNSTVVNSYVRLLCVNDNGTNSSWFANILGSPTATIA